MPIMYDKQDTTAHTDEIERVHVAGIQFRQIDWVLRAIWHNLPSKRMKRREWKYIDMCV